MLFPEKNLDRDVRTFRIVSPLVVPFLLGLKLVVDSERPVPVLGHHVFGHLQGLRIYLFRHKLYYIFIDPAKNDKFSIFVVPITHAFKFPVFSSFKVPAFDR